MAFKVQVQEWKNILLRGEDPVLLEKYLESFKANAIPALNSPSSNSPSPFLSTLSGTIDLIWMSLPGVLVVISCGMICETLDLSNGKICVPLAKKIKVSLDSFKVFSNQIHWSSP